MLFGMMYFAAGGWSAVWSSFIQRRMSRMYLNLLRVGYTGMPCAGHVLRIAAAYWVRTGENPTLSMSMFGVLKAHKWSGLRAKARPSRLP